MGEMISEVVKREILKLQQLATNPNELGQVTVHHSHLRGVAAQLENVVLPALKRTRRGVVVRVETANG